MKTKLLLFVVMALMLSVSAFAVTTVGNVALDLDDAVQRSNPLIEGSDNTLDDADDLEYVSFQIPVTVSGDTTTVTSVTPDLSGFNYQLGGSIDSSDLYEVQTSLPLVITNGTQSVTIRVLVPDYLDAIDSNFDALAHTITASVVTDDGTFNPTLSFYVENGLELNDVIVNADGETIECDVEEDDKTLDCDDEIEEVNPVSSFDLDFTIENIFDEDSDLDFEGVDIQIDSDNNDVDADDDSFDEDVDADSETSISVSFDVDEDLDDGDDATVTIEVSVEDENGALHGFRHEFTIEFQVADYDIKVSDLLLSPASVCAGDETTASFTIENIGSKKQNNIRAVLKNDALGLNKIFQDIVLDEEDEDDNTYRGTYDISIDNNERVGSYPIMLQVYYESDDDDDETSTTSAALVVRDCDEDTSAPTRPTTNSSTSPIVVVNPGTTNPTQPVDTTTTPVQAVAAQTSQTPYVVGLGLLIVVLVIVIVMLLATVFRK
ncbi:MAG TPA: hypothetical protein VK158_02040 [Acidobacteriota bacterium]|nr:hypothetical protein [Acidobacteriota bacterium]